MMMIISILPNDGLAVIYTLHIAAILSAVHSCRLAMLGILLAALDRNHYIDVITYVQSTR
jgi:hypothetical protein